MPYLLNYTSLAISCHDDTIDDLIKMQKKDTKKKSRKGVAIKTGAAKAATSKVRYTM